MKKRDTRTTETVLSLDQDGLILGRIERPLPRALPREIHFETPRFAADAAIATHSRYITLQAAVIWLPSFITVIHRRDILAAPLLIKLVQPTQQPLRKFWVVVITSNSLFPSTEIDPPLTRHGTTLNLLPMTAYHTRHDIPDFQILSIFQNWIKNEV